jgi:hypothetical protein
MRGAFQSIAAGGAAACLLVLASLAARPAPAGATDVATLQQACSDRRATYRPEATIPLRHPSGFRVLLPGRGCLRFREGNNLLAEYLIGVSETPDRTGRGIWTGLEATHTATAMILDLATVFEGPPPADLVAARTQLARDVAALPEGTLGRVLPHFYRRTDPFPEPIQHPYLTAAFTLRVIETTVGDPAPDSPCLPFTVVTQERRTGSGGFSRLLGVNIPTIVLRQRFEARLCLAPSGGGALVVFSERMLEGEGGDAARGAELRAQGRRFLDYITFAPAGG